MTLDHPGTYILPHLYGQSSSSAPRPVCPSRRRLARTTSPGLTLHGTVSKRYCPDDSAHGVTTSRPSETHRIQEHSSLFLKIIAHLSSKRDCALPNETACTTESRARNARSINQRRLLTFW